MSTMDQSTGTIESQVVDNTEKVISKDGTTIAFEKSGEGPAIVLVNGVMGDGALPVEAAHAATMPALVMDGGEREGEEFFHQAVQALVEALPNAQYRSLEGQPHGPAAPEALAPVLREFFAGSNGSGSKGEMS